MGTTTAWYAIRTPSQLGGRSRVASSTTVCVTRGAYPPRFCSSTTNHQPTIIVYHNQLAIKRPTQDICYISSQPKIDQGFFPLTPAHGNSAMRALPLTAEINTHGRHPLVDISNDGKDVAQKNPLNSKPSLKRPKLHK